jgi:hypothetical protein
VTFCIACAPKPTNSTKELLANSIDEELYAKGKQVPCTISSPPAGCLSALRGVLHWLWHQTGAVQGDRTTPQPVDQNFDWSVEAFEARKKCHLAGRCVWEDSGGSSCDIVQDNLTLDSLGEASLASCEVIILLTFT